MGKTIRSLAFRVLAAAGLFVSAIWAATAQEMINPEQLALAPVSQASAEEEVRQFMGRYFESVNEMQAGKSDSLKEAWSHAPDVTLMGHDGGRELGWDKVLSRYIGKGGRRYSGFVEPRSMLIQVSGEVACVSTLEHGEFLIGGKLVRCDYRGTMLLRRKQDGWRIVHSHVDIVPEFGSSGPPAVTLPPKR